MLFPFLRRAIPTTLFTLAWISVSVPRVLAGNASSHDLIFTVENRNSLNLLRLHAVPEYAGSWDNNLLRKPLNPNETTRVTIPNGGVTCTYDLLSVFSNDHQVEEYDINLCELNTYTPRRN